MKALRFLCLLIVCAAGGLEADQSDAVELTVSNLNKMVQSLFQPALAAEPDWLSRLELKFSAFGLQQLTLRCAGGVQTNWTGWSNAPTTLDVLVGLSTSPDKIRAELNNTRLDVGVTLATQVLPAIRFTANRYLERSCTPEAIIRIESPPEAEYRRAHCALAKRMGGVRTFTDVARGFAESIDDLNAQLSDYERGSFGAWEVLPKLSEDNGTERFAISARKKGELGVRGKLDLVLTESQVELKGFVVSLQDDSAEAKIASLLRVYLGGLLDANEEELASLQNSLVAFTHDLKPARGR